MTERDLAADRKEISEEIDGYYNHALNYNNVVILGGYASFFGLWGLTRDFLAEVHVLSSALLMSVSVVFFVGYEVWKMISEARDLSLKASAFNDDEALSAALTKMDRRRLRSPSTWYFVLLATIAPAVLGGAVLMSSFVSGLFRLY